MSARTRRPAAAVSLAALTLAGAAALAAPRAAGQAAAPDVLARRLTAAVRGAELGDAVGVHVRDAATGDPIFAHAGDVPRNPASNVKIVTAWAALRRLGPDFRMRTAVHGRIEEGGRVELLVLRGTGDPTLEAADLVALAGDLVDRGVRRVGRVRVDATYFEDEVDPPAYAQQPREIAPFRAPISAVAVDRNAYALRILPGASPGDPVTVRLAAPSHFDLDDRMTTGADGPPRVIADQRPTDDGRLWLRLSGTVPVDILGVTYRRRVEHPRLHAGRVFARALDRVGIRVGDAVDLGATPPGLPMLASRRSPPLATILTAMGKDSDNFTAEMVMRVIGAEGGVRTTAGGCAAAGTLLSGLGVPEGQATLVNGSGLFDGNLVSPAALTAVLADAYRDPAIRPEMVAHLATGGVDGTLARRLRALPHAGVVRAKTGTLADVVSLSGYVLGPAPGHALAFSVLVNGARGRIGPARRLADDIAGILAAGLWPG